MKIAILNVSTHLLIQALHLPEGTIIEDVRMTFANPNTIQLRITSDGLKEVPEGSVIPEVTATFKAVYEDVGKNKTATFTGWEYW